MLIENTLFGTTDKVQIAIDRLKTFEPPEGYFLAFSGGKDSQTIYHLAKAAGVKFDAHYNHTTVDPPELIYFMREHYPDVIADYPPITMWQLIVKKKFPMTRLVRYCCSVLKEGGGRGRTVVTGVRWAESNRRRATRGLLELNTYSHKKNASEKIILNSDNDDVRLMYETCKLQGKHILNPIINWTADDVWEYLNGLGVPHCCLYDEGQTRIGCIGCPMGGKKGMEREFARYPKYKAAYLHTFERMLKARAESGMNDVWQNAEDVMDWWTNGSDKEYLDENQLTFDDLERLREESEFE